MTSIVLLDEFQSLGTVQLEPEVRKTTVGVGETVEEVVLNCGEVHEVAPDELQVTVALSPLFIDEGVQEIFTVGADAAWTVQD